MLDNLMDLVKQYAGQPIINNPDIPNERNEEAVTEASHSIFDGLKNSVSGGNTSDLTNLFSGGEDDVTQSAVGQNIQENFIQKLMHKFGLDEGKASNIASTLIPAVLKKFVHKTNEPGDNSFDLKKILATVTGGSNPLGASSEGSSEGGGIMDKVKDLFK